MPFSRCDIPFHTDSKLYGRYFSDRFMHSIENCSGSGVALLTTVLLNCEANRR